MIDSSLQNGVSGRRSCSILIIQHRRIARWQQRIRRGRDLQDSRPGPTEALHKPLPEETAKIIAMAKDAQYSDLSHRILTETAVSGCLFQASFSTICRFIRNGGTHGGSRGLARPQRPFEATRAQGISRTHPTLIRGYRLPADPTEGQHL